ncbi:putative protein UPF0060 [Aromatoleum petrolei]|nr:YnfA family protein [Aromatoleum petrolei]QTQ35469.1 putative protein UPF0060 [Aromatoleum petrolei]
MPRSRLRRGGDWPVNDVSLHPAAAGRVYAAYGGVYVFVAIMWLWLVDGIRPTAWDIAGSLVAVAGMAIIMFAPRHA